MRTATRRQATAAMVLWLVSGWAGCATIDRGRTLVPSKLVARTGPFVVYSNAAMPGDAPVVRCLEALERDVARELGFRPAPEDEPVEIYVLDDREDFDHFLKFYYPELPTRRAFFIATGSQRLVYTYSSPRLDEDLRHEATHALLRGAYGDLPLWLDEGLAEHFEDDRSRPEAVSGRLDAIASDLRGHWKPDLERLESLTDIRQMGQRDYREAWGWVGLMLGGPEPVKRILLDYLSDPDRAEAGARLRPRLAGARLDEGRLLAYFDGLRDDLVASPPRETRAVRMQDQPVEPARPAPMRGLLRRIGSWLGGINSADRDRPGRP